MQAIEDYTRLPLQQRSAKEALQEVRTTVKRFNILPLHRQVEACETLLAENQFIDIAILGQFKAGKTSFINSLIGQPVLPVGVIPVTTVITRITRVQYGARERVLVRFIDGTHIEIALQDIENFISESKNPANAKNVAVVDVELPLFERYHGLRLVDTPGLGSAYKYNTATSEEWLPKVGAAIVAISAERPLSESDIQLIRELMDYTPEIVLLLTKADLLSPDQQAEVVNFLNETAQKELNRTFPIYLYSIKSDTDSYKRQLDTELFEPLSHNIYSELHKISRHKITSLGRSCASYLEVALNASLQADHEREAVKNLILDEKVNFELIRSELTLIAREHMLQTRTLINQHLNNMCKIPLTHRLVARLKEDMQGWNGNLSVFTGKFEQWVKDNMTRELHAISRSEHEHFFASLVKARTAILRRVNLFKTLLDSNIEKVLGIKMNSVDWNISITEPGSPDLTFTRTFDFHLELLWFLIPMMIFRKAFEQHFIKQLPWTIEVNLSRLSYQWEVSINKAIEEMKNKALAYVQEELSTIEKLMTKPHEQTAAIKRSLAAMRDIGGMSAGQPLLFEG
jgi:GTP-binding protein EngB required for normal cell division